MKILLFVIIFTLLITNVNAKQVHKKRSLNDAYSHCQKVKHSHSLYICKKYNKK